MDTYQVTKTETYWEFQNANAIQIYYANAAGQLHRQCGHVGGLSLFLPQPRRRIRTGVLS